jgi:hypothetical protein
MGDTATYDFTEDGLGIGDATPSYPLDVSGDVRITNSLGVGTTPHITNGRVDAANDIVAFVSDKRLKENVVPIDNALIKISKLTGITYNWNKQANELAPTMYDRDTRLVGLFAQDVQEVLPEAVKLAPIDNDGNDNSLSGENYLTVQYEKVVPLLVEAIKELSDEVKKLKESK